MYTWGNYKCDQRATTPKRIVSFNKLNSYPRIKISCKRESLMLGIMVLTVIPALGSLEQRSEFEASLDQG
jgi:hypothetical protein